MSCNFHWQLDLRGTETWLKRADCNCVRKAARLREVLLPAGAATEAAAAGNCITPE